MSLAGVGDGLQCPEHRRRQGVKPARHSHIGAVGGEQELHEIVGPHRQEIRAIEDFIEREQERRHFHHGADLHLVGQPVTMTPQMRQLAFDHLACPVELAHLRHHREHQPQFATRRGVQECPQLDAQ